MNLESLADLVGVSSSTMSRALLGRPGVSEKLRAEIRTLAIELAVKPHPGRQRARKQRRRFFRHSGPQLWLDLDVPAVLKRAVFAGAGVREQSPFDIFKVKKQLSKVLKRLAWRENPGQLLNLRFGLDKATDGLGTGFHTLLPAELSGNEQSASQVFFFEHPLCRGILYGLNKIKASGVDARVEPVQADQDLGIVECPKKFPQLNAFQGVGAALNKSSDAV